MVLCFSFFRNRSLIWYRTNFLLNRICVWLEQIILEEKKMFSPWITAFFCWWRNRRFKMLRILLFVSAFLGAFMFFYCGEFLVWREKSRKNVHVEGWKVLRSFSAEMRNFEIIMLTFLRKHQNSNLGCTIGNPIVNNARAHMSAYIHHSWT
jgi:hypothetical protein